MNIETEMTLRAARVQILQQYKFYSQAEKHISCIVLHTTCKREIDVKVKI